MTEIEYTVKMNLKQAAAGMGKTIGPYYYEPTTISAIVVVGKNPVK